MDLRESFRKYTDVSLKIAILVLSQARKGSNVLCSPLSFQVLLSLIASGAEGPALDQLLSFFRACSVDEINRLYSEIVSAVMVERSDGEGSKISFVNGAWVDQTSPLKAAFMQVVENIYKAESFPVDFTNGAEEVRLEVNSWAEEKTKGLIRDLLPPNSIDSSTRLIFANSLYFKGTWIDQFETSDTKDYPFYLANGSTVNVPFMTNFENQAVSVYHDFKVLKLPYEYDRKRKFSMYIFLPDANDGLPSLVEQIGSQVGFLDRHLPTRSFPMLDFRIPKFKISYGFEASETFEALGVSLIFDSDGGGLTKMTNDKDLYVSRIFQKSFIRVSEEGTEAAVVTEVDSSLGYAMDYIPPKRTMEFVADHQFLFVIREDTAGVVMFVGSVMNPME